jgi:nicotinate-nucleotide adenylyltransferase
VSTAAQRAPQQLGIFGGTFDPIHVAHLRCADEAREQLGLSRVLFIPAADPPHKSRRMTPAAQRLAMVRLAIAGNPAFAASTLELERRGPSYTVDTLRQLRATLPASTRLTLLIGLDSYRDLATWHQYRMLFWLADVAVWTRPQVRLGSPRAMLPVAARGDFCYGTNRSELIHHSGNRIRFLTVTALDISASVIRQRVQRGQSVRYLVPASVERYMRRAALYRQGRASS